MPTYEVTNRFRKDFEALSPDRKAEFRRAIDRFRDDLASGRPFRKGLRVKRIRGTNVFEMTWAPDGRATFEYGREIINNEPHVIWRRIGTHEVFGAS